MLTKLVGCAKGAWGHLGPAPFVVWAPLIEKMICAVDCCKPALYYFSLGGGHQSNMMIALIIIYRLDQSKVKVIAKIAVTAVQKKRACVATSLMSAYGKAV